MAVQKTSTMKPVGKVRTLAGISKPAPDPERTRALEQYEAAVRLMHEGKYDKAHTAFEKLLAITPPDFADRIRMYLTACTQHSVKSKTSFNTLEEQYDYAISLINDGHFDDARESLKEILKKKSQADYAFYGLAILASMTGDAQNCLENLGEAIRLNGLNRIQARSDSDFQEMADDPRFTEMLYPEA